MKAEVDDGRLRRLYEAHYAEILAYCLRRIGPVEAEDVAGEVFAIAWRKLDDLDWETPRPWLYGVARRVLANRWRSAKRRRRLSERLHSQVPDSVTPPDTYVIGRVADEAIIAALQRLRPPDQEVLRLAAWEELTAPEIAQVLGISRSAAEQRLHRAKKRLAQAVAEIRQPDHDLPADGGATE